MTAPGSDRPQPFTCGLWLEATEKVNAFSTRIGAANLQSSVNAEGGRGTSALMAYYAAFIASSIFLPAVMIRIQLAPLDDINDQVNHGVP
ncbi:Protein of unknown function [Gryllus bimaculatus]|nr:Protein of unknown function [Gryllus bimaculatus]